MWIYRLIILLIPVFILSSLEAQNPDEAIIYTTLNYSFPYRTDQPVNTWKLPHKLVEVSGLAFIDEARIACVQDEKGNIYVFNLVSGEIESKIDFGDAGDYEGIEITGPDAWVVKSNGNLYRVKHFMNDTNSTLKKYHTGLSRKNEPEGISYDPLSHSLLIACKGGPYLDEKKGKSIKAVYSFDLESKALNKQPEFLISLDTIKSIRNYNTMTRLGLDLLSSLDEPKGDVTFQPSGIAIHPITGHIYLIGAVGNLLLVLDRDGNFMAIVELKSKLFVQPEGICFSPSGDLYIANEGKDRNATLLQFKMN